MSGIERWFHPVLPVASLGAEPVPVLLGGEPYVLFRGPEGRPAAVADRCAHRLAPLSKGKVLPSGRIACPYHGWHYGPDGQGDSPHFPGLANCKVKSLQVVEKYDTLWVAAQGVPLEAFPAMGWEGWEYAGYTSVRFPAPLHVCLDNFTENEHTPWIHQMLGWEEADAGKVEFEHENFEDHTEVHYRAPQRPSGWLPLLGVKAKDTFHNDWETHFNPVRSIYSLSWSDPATGTMRPLGARFCIFMVPESDRVTVYHSFLFVQIRPSWYTSFAPIVKRVTGYLGGLEIKRDAEFIGCLADTPLEMKGMRLTKFDRPLIHHRKLLRRIYRGEGEATEEAAK